MFQSVSSPSSVDSASTSSNLQSTNQSTNQNDNIDNDNDNDNIFTLSQYVSNSNTSPGHSNNSNNNTSNDSQSNIEHDHDHDNNDNDNDEIFTEAAVLHMIDLHNNEESTKTISNTTTTTTTSTKKTNKKKSITPTSSASSPSTSSSSTSSSSSTVKPINVVHYSPTNKPKRLGRPRNKINLKINEISSNNNLDNSIISKFRFDNKPLIGPGSRGGKNLIKREPRGIINKRNLRGIKSEDIDKNEDIKSEDIDQSDIKSDEENQDIDHEDNDIDHEVTEDNDIDHEDKDTKSIKPQKKDEKKKNKQQSSLLNFFTSTKNNKISQDEIDKINKDNNDNDNENKSKIKKSTSPKSKSTSSSKATPSSKSTSSKSKPTKSKINKSHTNLSKITSTSRTTVLNNRHKITRQLPGPVLPLYYDQYDDNLINDPENISLKNEKLALGFPIKQKSYINHIIYIISFLNTFKEIISIGDIGPQDIEIGLGFISDNEENLEGENNYVSPTMESLFLKLLTLILNRKNPIQATGQIKSISELKSMIKFLGLPKEWKITNDSIMKPEIIKINEDDLNYDLNLSSSSSSNVITTEFINYKSVPHNTVKNPFNDKTQNFENLGLRGIKTPMDKLIMIKCLIQWSLISSNLIKNFISNSMANQDIMGEKETYYASRSILKGFKQTQDLKRDIELKLSKRKNGGGTGGANDDLKYVDPTSNPLIHSMKLRFNELIIGDVGFNIGRFYLVRMSNELNGGLNSINEMKLNWLNKFKNQSTTINLPSKFKLYVYDIHSMLTDSLSDYGIEFDENGTEISKDDEKHENNYWYEIASNTIELVDFINHLRNRLGIDNDKTNSKSTSTSKSNTDNNQISKNSIIYKPLLNLFNYLSSIIDLLIKQEEDSKLLNSNSRGSRKRNNNINYSDFDNSKKIIKLSDDFIDDDDDFDDNTSNNVKKLKIVVDDDDDEAYIEFDEDDDDEILNQNDNDDDDDYSD